ncbi:MAG: Type II secretory pathway, pseudopilin PulG [candidate division WWE3 bacterium GW2011_GWF2_41_45]|uniref:Type II secretion system protein GspG C-terminal domain-containing protein n=3 Tax=Katanobacteria TaxID=422282 RepID=A0A1F4W2M3_UNCKA|nr:MAG: Type II secretory pathway, pseudopilin PulG [candidate division WWE3 bacterium GW2011_GWC2_41_23]KKS10530.1 MAG: Type II secretory pathway, pseudopilin PulG [candidate division WWE3 bacterium GW2011_GWF2_41_45]KKS20275.1 MAG: Type II secretory pathway, pseudopilin PulG [candidate division WWE3 bacterium GW2011_GWE1_41_72]KKS30277.1 MAG: Type II secretory pathway, pseudopilin PulG [candidate division WWE3 bacterium GW2011_GWD2_42_11]KKS51031.1 MAG: Type II secretory pathway, pseudopilin 
MKRNPESNAFTLLEITIVMAVLLILIGVTISLISPVSSKGKARDNKRLSDISTLDRVINEYRLDYGQYPGLENFLYTSNYLPAGSPDLYSARSGWIPVDISDYTTRYSVDPVNDAIYHYEYFHNSADYEVSTRLEQLMDKASEDGGNDPLKYELGTNLLLITP